MEKEYLKLLVDLHLRQGRQGPGSEEQTVRAMHLANLSKVETLRVADIGCGTGASTLQLASRLNAEVTAVDFLSQFIDVLKSKANDAGLSERINTLVCSMEELPFADEEFDVIWSEGAIYNMGFRAGLVAWKRFLKSGGVIAVSEVTWTTGNRPGEIEKHWNSQYPEIGTASSKLKVLEDCGYSPIGYFVLPEECWLKNYYEPLEVHFSSFLEQHKDNVLAKTIIDEERTEIELYKNYKEFFSYGFYIAKKV